MASTTPTVTQWVDDDKETMTDFEKELKEMIDKAFEKAMEAVRKSLAEWAMESRTTSHLPNDDKGEESDKVEESTHSKEIYSDVTKLLTELPALQVFDEKPERRFVKKAPMSISQGTKPIICSLNPYWNALKTHFNMVMVYKLHENEYGKCASKLDSQPEEIDNLDRKRMQLEIEIHALEKERDKVSKARVGEVKTELVKARAEQLFDDDKLLIKNDMSEYMGAEYPLSGLRVKCTMGGYSGLFLDSSNLAGQAYEAMNNAGCLDNNLIIVLNDNKQVSLPTATVDGVAPPVGALSKALLRLQSSRKFCLLREAAKGLTKQMGDQAHDVAAKFDSFVRGVAGGHRATMFEELGLYYIGPVDWKNLEDLVYIFEKLKSMPEPGPVLIHIITEKGKGYPPAEITADKIHGVVKFDSPTGKQHKSKSDTLSYTQYFANALIAEANSDEKVVAIHATMGGGTGLNSLQKHFPSRCFDAGIAEQHAVTFAAGLAIEGLKPFCAIYFSFLQRGYDQVVHDVDLQKLPVRFAMDRAGLVGADGPTHCGAFDTTFMACLPNMVVMAPSCETELMHMVAAVAAIDDRPSCFRYPRGNGIGSVLPPNNKGSPLEIGKGRVMREGSRVAILGYGTIVQSCLAAAQLLQEFGIFITVADARFCKPLDGDLIRELVREHEVLVTVEEGSIGGFGSHVSNFLSLNGLLDGNLKWRAMMLPDRYIDHGAQKDQIEQAGLTPNHIAATVLSLIGESRESLHLSNP